MKSNVPLQAMNGGAYKANCNIWRVFPYNPMMLRGVENPLICVDISLPVVGDIVNMSAINASGEAKIDINLTGKEKLKGVMPKESIFSIQLDMTLRGSN